MAKIATDIVSSHSIILSVRTLADHALQRKTFPRTDDVVVSYIAGLVDDEDEEVDDIVEMTRGMLQAGPSKSDNQSLDDL